VNDVSLSDLMEPPQRIARGRPASSVPVRVARRLRKRMTPQEVKLWVKLREQRVNGLHFRRQVPIGRCVVDFACLKHRLVVEVDGGQHSFDNAVAADRSRDLTLKSLGFPRAALLERGGGRRFGWRGRVHFGARADIPPRRGGWPSAARSGGGESVIESRAPPRSAVGRVGPPLPGGIGASP
jgi:very-short-patch-repair endonuclease